LTVDKLKLLSKRKRKLYTVEDLVFDSIEKSLGQLSLIQEAAGFLVSEFEVSDGVHVVLPMSHDGSWEDRLDGMHDVAKSIAQTEEVDFESVRLNLVKADGWIVRRGTVKTPSWMQPHVELEADALPERYRWVLDLE
jgi:hypothetical protein